MSKKSIDRGRVARAEGLFPTLQARSKTRRETQKTLTKIGSISPGSGRNDLSPDLRIEFRPIETLKPAPRRLRKVDPFQAARLDRSLAEYGVCQPVLVDRDGHIVHGHGVWEAAKRAGLDRIAVITVDHLPPAKLRKLAITLNRLGETGTWDAEVLEVELSELLELEEDVVVTGFELAEIDALLLDEESPDANEEVLPPLPPVPTSRPGDLWRLGDHLLLQGDALDEASWRRLFDPGEQARFVLTDEPFNVPIVGHVTGKAHHREFAEASGEMTPAEFAAFNRDWFTNAAAAVVDGGLIATFIDWRSIEIVLATARELGLTLLNIVVWSKTNAGQGSLWRSQHELLPVFKKGTAPHVNAVLLGKFGRWRSNVWVYPGGSSLGSEARGSSDDHPTVKPRAMLEDALLDVTHRGDIVADPFSGSGSTLLAAEATGRICRAIEIDGCYCGVIVERWQVLTGRSAELVETGETFAEVATRRIEHEASEADHDDR